MTAQLEKDWISMACLEGLPWEHLNKPQGFWNNVPHLLICVQMLLPWINQTHAKSTEHQLEHSLHYLHTASPFFYIRKHLEVKWREWWSLCHYGKKGRERSTGDTKTIVKEKVLNQSWCEKDEETVWKRRKEVENEDHVICLDLAALQSSTIDHQTMLPILTFLLLFQPIWRNIGWWHLPFRRILHRLLRLNNSNKWVHMCDEWATMSEEIYWHLKALSDATGQWSQA